MYFLVSFSFILRKLRRLLLVDLILPSLRKALTSLATYSGIHPLVPDFTFFVAVEVSRNLNNFSPLFALMRLVWSHLQNPHIHIEPYLHQLMPSVMTCLVAKRLGNKFSDLHWDLRNFTANLVASICKRFGHVYHNLQPVSPGRCCMLYWTRRKRFRNTMVQFKD